MNDVVIWVMIALNLALGLHTAYVNRQNRKEIRRCRTEAELREQHRTISWHSIVDKPQP
jgi:hypothetical protein